MTLEQMKDIDIRTVDVDTLVDVDGFNTNLDLPKLERMTAAVKYLGNPYCFKSGRTAIKVSYVNTTAKLDERIADFMIYCFSGLFLSVAKSNCPLKPSPRDW